MVVPAHPLPSVMVNIMLYDPGVVKQCDVLQPMPVPSLKSQPHETLALGAADPAKFTQSGAQPLVISGVMVSTGTGNTVTTTESITTAEPHASLIVITYVVVVIGEAVGLAMFVALKPFEGDQV